jgi:hypothetical protein
MMGCGDIDLSQTMQSKGVCYFFMMYLAAALTILIGRRLIMSSINIWNKHAKMWGCNIEKTGILIGGKTRINKF